MEKASQSQKTIGTNNNGTQQPQPEEAQIIEEKISKVNGEIAIKKYQKGKLLGRGGFARCYELTNLETKKVLAGKIIPKSTLTKNRARQKLISEIKIHKALHHTNIVQFEHVFEDSENVYILLELCSNQTLNELIKRRKRLLEIEAQCYISQIIQALKYLQSNRVIHRDLKLGNLFLSEKMELKLGDFGLATKLEFDGEKKRTICGTPNYIAPEILDGKIGHSYEVDTWSLGVVIYTLIIGKPPFETPDVKSTYKKIRSNQYSFPEHVPISDNSRNLIVKILNLDPSKRPTLDEILDHPFMNPEGSIPKLMPLSTLACPPSGQLIKQFQGDQPIKNQMGQQKLIETMPIQTNNNNNNKKIDQNQQQVFGSTNSFNKQTGGLSEKTGYQKTQTPIYVPMDSQQQQNSKKDAWGTQTATQFKPATTQSTQKISSATGTNYGMMGQGIQSQTNFNKMDANLNICQMNSATSNGIGSGTEVWVKSWVDYSSKYGLGYMLSNGCAGVFFNDSTKIIVDNQGQKFDYLERKSNDKQDVVIAYTFTEYPKELQKKVTLLQHFKNYLDGDKQNQMNLQDQVNQISGKPLVYVKKWMKTRHAIMFRLSNKIVQVNFTDKTEILLSSENKQVTYVNKKGERSHFPLATALESNNTEMSKRLKYTKEILTHMLNANAKNVAQQKDDKIIEQQTEKYNNDFM